MVMRPSVTTVMVGRHLVSIERLERLRWRVSVDGKLFATFCSEGRARAGGRHEARRLDFAATAGDEGGARGPHRL